MLLPEAETLAEDALTEDELLRILAALERALEARDEREL